MPNQIIYHVILQIKGIKKRLCDQTATVPAADQGKSAEERFSSFLLYIICYIKLLNVTICKMSNLSIFLEFVFNLYAAESPLRFFQIFSRELSKLL